MEYPPEDGDHSTNRARRALTSFMPNAANHYATPPGHCEDPLAEQDAQHCRAGEMPVWQHRSQSGEAPVSLGQACYQNARHMTAKAHILWPVARWWSLSRGPATAVTRTC